MMKSLWTDEVSEYKGEHLRLEPSWAFPKPVQQPHPPIIMGGAAAPKTIADMVEFCDGWMPLATRHDIAGRLEEVRNAVADSGRDVKSFDITAYSAKADPELIERLVSLDINRIVFNLPQKSPEDVNSRLASLGEVISKF
jgi:alkanesulfonate monooxygenase SsuD/methylene tetrahydromethanopterin reductase-like flavin-dependent oxidoreductase (luciferase family)